MNYIDKSTLEEEIPKNYYYPLQDKWRYTTPDLVKDNINEWTTLSPKDLEVEVKKLLDRGINSDIRDDIEDFLCTLDDIILDEEYYIYDQLEIIAKYKDGRVEVEDKSEVELNDSWRDLVPLVIKQKFKDWKSTDLEDLYERSKTLLETNRKEIMPFVAELSRYIFDDKDEDEDDEVSSNDFEDEVSISIMSTVEMIILPHIEVLDIIQKKGGKITFSNLWHKPFTEEIKKEVKDRDGWKCVICEGETHLHVHHKIPREKGGIHHHDNLVTLCASCHGAVETADIKKAFQKGLSNYNKNKYNRMRPQEILIDKSLLKSEVEHSLDSILYQLNRKNENELMEELAEVMQKLEILFYD